MDVPRDQEWKKQGGKVGRYFCPFWLVKGGRGLDVLRVVSTLLLLWRRYKGGIYPHHKKDGRGGGRFYSLL
jgi:hypothetical protein